MLVTKAQNDRAGNLELARKLDIYFGAQAAPIPAINEDLRGRTQWQGADIKAREAELLQLIEELWKFDLARLRESAPEPTPPKPKHRRKRS